MTTLGLSEGKKTVLIFGGSRGATPINEAVIAMQNELKKRDYQVLYVTGEVHYDKVTAALKKEGPAPNMVVQPFLHQMPEYLKEFEVVVARAGATTIAEITALGIPSVLIPSPYVTANHQEVNARSLGEQNAAVVLKESELNGDRLIQAIDHILQDEKTLQEMKSRAKSLGVPDAAERLYNVLKELKHHAK